MKAGPVRTSTVHPPASRAPLRHLRAQSGPADVPCAPLTSEPPLTCTAYAPLTSEPPLTCEAALTSEPSVPARAAD
ncbi:MULTISPECIES: hypothetical protein [unclassified Streptomyces]|uniref:hypothetical protein n=1 Tax=unclassified Streptomyces TaxID=2593676 RepID=UPI002E3152E7|nr:MULTISPECIES: hypothetical protein [unclassified Streptomyces]WUC66429.1 hypothetical protein OG861_20600 [Streptomyces sp. NBC_00539]